MKNIEVQRRLNPIVKEVVKKKKKKQKGRLKLFSGKLKSRWSGPFRIAQIFPFGAVQLEDKKSRRKFKVNGQRIKHYFGGVMDRQQEAMPLHYR